MTNIDPRAAEKFQSDLSSGELIHWAAKPDPTIIFHSDDWALIPISFLWGGFAIFWEAGVLGLWEMGSKSGPFSWFMALGGIPFVAIGQYMIWGRFVWDAWLKRRTFYAISNRRVLILQEGWSRKNQDVFLDSISEISRDGDFVGTIWLGPKLPQFGGRRSATRGFSRLSLNDAVPNLADIDRVDSVYHLILDLRERARKEGTNGAIRPSG